MNGIIRRAYTLPLHEAFWWVEAHQKQNREARGPKRTISCIRVGWGVTPAVHLLAVGPPTWAAVQCRFGSFARNSQQFGSGWGILSGFPTLWDFSSFVGPGLV